jgi:predicted ATPase
MGPMKSLTENEVSVLVSEKLGSQAVIRRLEIGKEFQFEKMPQGFMTQATEDRIQLLRAASKRNG